MQANTKYEELGCIGFYPELDLLEAIIAVKLPYGYKGNLCSAGSYEYVRFFIDWDGDGDYLDPDEDVGIASVNVHDIPEEEGFCLDETKPMSFVLSLKISSRKMLCKMPHLVKVRAILSWDNPPTAGNPDFPVVWGNVMEQWVQVRPTRYRFKDVLDHFDLSKLLLKTPMLDLETPVSQTVQLSAMELAEIYRKEDVPEHRYNFPVIKDIADRIKKYPSSLTVYQQDPQFKKIEQAVVAVLKAKPSTRYEELKCVGLNNDQDQLAATLTVKLSSGVKRFNYNKKGGTYEVEH